MEGFDFTQIRETVSVPFRIGIHQLENGSVPRFVHEFALPDDSNDLAALLERFEQAGAGLEGAERRKAATAGLYEFWAALVRSVGGDYAPHVRALTGPELVAYFKGERLPDGLDERTRARALEGMRHHVDVAMRGLLERLAPEPSFRGEGG